MRLFAAVDCPYDYKLAYSRIFPHLKKKYSGIKWSDPENLHITLAFFGEAGSDLSAEIEEKLGNVKLGKAFHIKALHADFMPGKNPGVISQKMETGHSFLRHINLQMQKIFPEILTDKRPFRAHLTLGRIKSPFYMDIPELDNLCCDFMCSEFCLFESELKKGGPVYSIIKKYSLHEAGEN